MPRETQAFLLARTLQALFEKLNNRSRNAPQETVQYEKLFGDPWLSDLRKFLGQRVFQKCICSYVVGLRLNCTELEGDEDLLSDERTFHKVLLNDGEGIYSCECQFSEKTGLPCEHIFKVLLMKKKGYTDHVQSRCPLGFAGRLAL